MAVQKSKKSISRSKIKRHQSYRIKYNISKINCAQCSKQKLNHYTCSYCGFYKENIKTIPIKRKKVE